MDFDVKNEFALARKTNEAQLAACGFEAVTKHLTGDESQKDLDGIFANLPRDVPVMLGAFHSQSVHPENQLFATGLNFLAGDREIDGLAYLEKMKKAAPGSPQFLDTCYAGVCHVVGASEVATATCSIEQSHCTRETEQTVPEREMIKVLCDSINDCSIFNGVRKKDDSGWEKEPWDANLDGFLDGEELTKYFRKNFSNGQEGRTSLSAGLVSTDRKVIARAEKDCAAKGGKGSVKSEENFKYQVASRYLNHLGVELSKNTTDSESDLPLGREHPPEFDHSRRIAEEQVKVLKQVGFPNLRVTGVTLAADKNTLKGTLEPRVESTSPADKTPASFEQTISRVTTGVTYYFWCNGGNEAPRVESKHSKDAQHPIFPKAYRIRCRKDAAKRS